MLLPNQLTVLRIILTPVFFFLFMSDLPVLKQISAVVFIIAAVTDWYDGWLARKFNYITKWGKFLDPLADKILTSAAFIAFVMMGVLELWMVVIIMFRDFFITFMRLYADIKGEGVATSIMAKWKTFFQMSFLYYLLLIYVLKTIDCIYKGNEQLFARLADGQMVYYIMFLITMLTVYTGLAYLYSNRGMIMRIFRHEK
ncbi:MAG: CDP-diacylglycerol--glycerol-3-phosphate 3-phosphatidyltransferase [Bacteroidota bacterium]